MAVVRTMRPNRSAVSLFGSAMAEFRSGPTGSVRNRNRTVEGQCGVGPLAILRDRAQRHVDHWHRVARAAKRLVGGRNGGLVI